MDTIPRKINISNDIFLLQVLLYIQWVLIFGSNGPNSLETQEIQEGETTETIFKGFAIGAQLVSARKFWRGCPYPQNTKCLLCRSTA